ncbi:alpha/beta hydrolase [Chromohalobacter japonicus]|uniref:Alpha/beta hydrolase n=1 Tax=Chromohalobacter japonicus TaxID=223900 RepID=A0A1Q8T8E2_9GAMM|nr:alpha/beta hydrolase [Chromohalobacter japonicus]OLO09942.1 alpha/beta hydrolase [Chromohalobacter japonicus]
MIEFEPITGRYATLEIQGRRSRVYIEESGHGIPVLCLHTAGADSRQYRHFQTDLDVLDRFRVIAFDLPWHGKSLPPEQWWTREYLLTHDLYVETVIQVIRALRLEQPIVVGCSMAGSLVLELARLHGDELGGVVGFSCAAKVNGRFQDWPLMPDVNSNQSVPSWTAALMAPQSPQPARKEVWWIYSQGGAGVYRGDTYFYSHGLDLRGREEEIDTDCCPVYLYTGEYDFACLAEDTEATLAKIPGAKGGRMGDIGHFPISENYPLCKTWLWPALWALADLRPDR